MTDERNETLISLTADIVAAHVENNAVAVSDLPDLIAKVHGALAGLGGPVATPAEPLKPAVSIRGSVTKTHLTCLECGLKFTTIKRHLANSHGLKPEDYRARWGFPNSYPVAAESYSEQRRAMAKAIGLGRKPSAKTPARKTKKS